METLKDECYKALRCLYITVDEVVAKDANEKIRAYIEELEKQVNSN